jgi:hypothetical protein
VRLREIALWVIVAALGVALCAEHNRVPELERDVVDYAQGAATASDSAVADWIVQAESRAKEIEHSARNAIADLNRKTGEQRRKRGVEHGGR